jgi:hypothetical protein
VLGAIVEKIEERFVAQKRVGAIRVRADIHRREADA